MKKILEKDKIEQKISGKCMNIIAYNKPSLHCGLITVNNPGYFNFFLKFDESNKYLKLRPHQEFVSLYKDMIQISYNSKNFLVQSNSGGQILMCQDFESKKDLKFSMIFEDQYRISIETLGFISLEIGSYLFFLDQNGNVSTIQFVQIEKTLSFQPSYSIHQQVEFMIPSSDQSSILIVDKYKNFIIYNKNSVFEGQLKPQILEIDNQEQILLSNDKNYLLQNIVSIDYSQDEYGYNIYILDQEFLYKLYYQFGQNNNKVINVKQIIHVDQKRGLVQKVFAYPCQYNYPYEVTIVQQFSVDQYKLTKEFKSRNIWINNTRQGQIAYNYIYKLFGQKFIHMIHHIANSSDNNKFKYDSEKGFIYAFCD